MRSHQYPKDIFKKIKDQYSVNWIHNLGAGWNIQDIQGYMKLSDLDSIDSIAYYNATHTQDGNWTRLKGTKQQKVLANASYVTKITL